MAGVPTLQSRCIYSLINPPGTKQTRGTAHPSAESTNIGEAIFATGLTQTRCTLQGCDSSERSWRGRAGSTDYLSRIYRSMLGPEPNTLSSPNVCQEHWVESLSLPFGSWAFVFERRYSKNRAWFSGQSQEHDYLCIHPCTLILCQLGRAASLTDPQPKTTNSLE